MSGNKIIQGDRGDVFFGCSPLGFLLDPTTKIGMLVAENGILSVGGLCRRNELIALGHVMHITDGVPPALQEKRDDEARSGRRSQAGLEGVYLAGKMPPQRGIAAADDFQFDAGLLRRLRTSVVPRPRAAVRRARFSPPVSSGDAGERA